MTHPLLRPAELMVGVVVLLSVASVPIPRKAPPAFPPVAVDYPARVGELHRQTQEQAHEVTALTEETRQLSKLLQIQQQNEMAHPPRNTHRSTHRPGIVAPHDPSRSDSTPSVGVPRLGNNPL